MKEILQFIKNHPVLFITWAFLFFSVAFIAIRNYLSKVINITCSEAIYLINKEDAVVIDLRNSEDFCKKHIVNSLNLSSKEIKIENLGKLIRTKRKPIIVVCTNGTISCGVAKKLVNFGFERVFLLKEGIFGWNKENLPLVRSKQKI
ncbi:rhodanese-like domain-containing protein [Sodalis sp. CWE]|uniref:rhodanese-like domain-containing protein n=1 Tax=Sodalis sp. CWE TaxID=2803816 RepID=UPI001C7CFFC1|nr:rhodanese-like domain-containing protein [Sodalis sp. CWE]MBX4180961.1 rhodanese-like domain-containing protein [Sodalis sp. CWE]